MLDSGAIRQVRPTKRDVESLLFAVRKKDGVHWRPCLDLRPLNSFVVVPPLSLEGLGAVRQVLQPGDFMVSIDLRDAYWHVPISRRQCHLLRFRFGGRSYQFDVLPFGVSVAPWAFSNVLRPVLEWLRRRGIRCVGYLDDLLFVGSTPTECVEAAQMAVDLLHDLGFVFSPEKSDLAPSRQLAYLGFEIDTSSMSLSLPREKIHRITRECRRVVHWADRGRPPSLRSLSRLLGRITAASDAVALHRLRTVHLERARALCLHRGGAWDSPCPISHRARGELRWWASSLSKVHGRPIRLPGVDLLLRTDASALGWGATVVQAPFAPHLVGQRFSGRLPPALRQSISNETEIYAISQAVLLLQRLISLQDRHVRIQSDNSAAVFYINKGGGRSLRLSSLVRPLWLACRRAGLVLSAEYLPGTQNVVADALSRRSLRPSDWTLTQGAFRLLCHRFGHPTVDAFAEPANAKLPRFASRLPFLGALAVSGLHLDYTTELAYAFPPPHLVPLLLTRLLAQRARAILVVPLRPQAPWWPVVLRHLRRPIVLRSAVRSYFRRARSFSQPRLLAGIFCASQ